jgi:hypothetical protein
MNEDKIVNKDTDTGMVQVLVQIQIWLRTIWPTRNRNEYIYWIRRYEIVAVENKNSTWKRFRGL